MQFWGNLKKYQFQYRNSVLNQLKNQQFTTCYSSLQHILLKMTINIPLKWEISTRAVTLQKEKFFSVTTGLKRWLTVTFLHKLFAYKLSYKKKSVKQRVTGSFFRRQRLIKDRDTQIWPPLIWTGLSDFENSYVRWWCESSFFRNYHCSKW